MKQGKYFIVYILMCSILFCSCSKEEKKKETIKESKKEVIEEIKESPEQEPVVDSGLAKVGMF